MQRDETMRNLKFKLVSLSLIVAISSVLAFVASPSLMANAQTKPAILGTCSTTFTATVRQGPSTNTTLSGTLSLDLSSDGSVTGQLTEKDGTHVAVAGQVIGRAISIALQLKPFDLAKGDKGSYIFGTGTAFDPINGNDCGGAMGGTFSGPQDGDEGDWASVCLKIVGIEVVCLEAK
jgi:hypothetical protein